MDWKDELHLYFSYKWRKQSRTRSLPCRIPSMVLLAAIFTFLSSFWKKCLPLCLPSFLLYIFLPFFPLHLGLSLFFSYWFDPLAPSIPSSFVPFKRPIRLLSFSPIGFILSFCLIFHAVNRGERISTWVGREENIYYYSTTDPYSTIFELTIMGTYKRPIFPPSSITLPTAVYMGQKIQCN